MWIETMTKLESEIGYSFKNHSLLERALTHSSYANENRNSRLKSNERLEFLGDSVLGMLAAEGLYGRKPELPEGQMTRLRAELVCEQSLANLAEMLGLGEYLRLGKGEDSGGGRKRPSILADAVEALIAAVYIDGGIEKAREFVQKFLLIQLDGEMAALNTDYKTALQELIQQNPAAPALKYELIGESGPDHQKVFSTEVRWGERSLGQGSGRTKKEAEQNAARAALELIRSET